jgi:hypothetical protein
MKTAILSWWPVARGSWWIQCRLPHLSAYLRGLKTVRKVGYAVAGTHQTLWRFDGTERKLRMIVRGLDRELSARFVSVENQAQARRAVLLP